MQRRAQVRFDDGFAGEPPRIWAEAGDRSRNFTELARAIRWAERRAERVTVVIDGLGAWDVWPPSSEDDERIHAHVRRRLERFHREFRERRSEPVEWFYAVRDPDVESVDTLVDDLAKQPGIAGVARRDRWWVVRVSARTAREAELVGGDAFTSVAWPDERIDREIGRGRDSYSYFVSAGGVTIFGLAEFEDEKLEEAAHWR